MTIREARCPVVTNVAARPVVEAGAIREALQAQLLGAVRWEESMRLMLAQGAQGFVELGSGKVLRGLLRTIDKDSPSWNAEDPESLAATLAALGAAHPAGRP